MTQRNTTEQDIAEMLRGMDFERICVQEPSDEELEPSEDGSYPVEYADHVWKRDRDREFVVVSIPRCDHTAYKSSLIIDMSDVVASELAEQSA